jgi:hypothetical protein
VILIVGHRPECSGGWQLSLGEGDGVFLATIECLSGAVLDEERIVAVCGQVRSKSYEGDSRS